MSNVSDEDKRLTSFFNSKDLPPNAKSIDEKKCEEDGPVDNK